jgi:hypothetical protein
MLVSEGTLPYLVSNSTSSVRDLGSEEFLLNHFNSEWLIDMLVSKGTLPYLVSNSTSSIQELGSKEFLLNRFSSKWFSSKRMIMLVSYLVSNSTLSDQEQSLTWPRPDQTFWADQDLLLTILWPNLSLSYLTKAINPLQMLPLKSHSKGTSMRISCLHTYGACFSLLERQMFTSLMIIHNFC